MTDLRGAAAGEVSSALLATRDELDHRAYDPRQWPLFELRLTRTDDRTILHVSVDFLIADYLSIQVLLDELHQAYDGVELPELEITFRDYLLAERGSREGSRYERDRAYWLDRLPELPGAPELPVRQRGDADPAGRPDQRTPGRFRRLSTTVAAQRWTALQRAAREQRLTPSTVVLAAVAEVIGRWSSNPRFCLNLTLLNREPVHPQIGRLVGDFTTVSLLAVETAPEHGFAERARAVQDRLWVDMDHRQFSGVSVMRELARERGRSAALMPVVFTSTLGLGEESESESETGLSGRVGYGRSQTPQVWIDAQALVERGALTVRWDVREGIFPDGVVDDMFGELSALLHRLATEPEAWQLPSPVDLPSTQHRSRPPPTTPPGHCPRGC